MAWRVAPAPTAARNVGPSAQARPSWQHAGTHRKRFEAHRLHATTQHRERERVLRYPGGYERRIIYPVATLDEEADELSGADNLWSGRGAPPAADVGAHHAAQLQQQQPVAPSSAAGCVQALARPQLGAARQASASVQETAALLEGLFAASYTAQPLVDAQQSYEVLSGCPWVMTRPVFVLTSQHWGWQTADGIQTAYTLRVRVEQQGAVDALAKLLNKQHLARALEVSVMQDGLVMFECAEGADRFASMLEEEGHSQVMVAEVDSHQVFRMLSDAKALAVLLRGDGAVPPPYQLAASLKRHQGLA